jgi:hypothetical protein
MADSNKVATTTTQNIVPVAAEFDTAGNCLGLVGPGGKFFTPPGQGTGDVNGPSSSTDEAITRFNGTTGQLIQNSNVTISDTGAVNGITNLSFSGALNLSNGQGTSGQVPVSQGAGLPVIWGAGGGGGGGTVTSVGGTGTVSGITLSGTVTSAGNLTLGGALNLSAPPAIGGTTPNSGAFTTLTASTSLTTSTVQASNSGGLALKNAGGTTQISMGGGGGDNLSINVSTNINGANAAISISPTGTGSVVINPATAGTIDNMVIGGTTANAVSATNLAYTGTLTGGTGIANIGSGQIYKDANGNLGLGTTTPTIAGVGRALAIDSTTGTAIEFRQSGTRVLNLIASSASSAVVAAGTTLSLGAGGSTKFQMDSNGAWLVGNNAGTAGQAFTSGGNAQPAVWADVQNGFIGGFTFNAATVGGQALETLNAITGVTTTLVISDEGTGDGAAIAAYFTDNGSSAVYRFFGDTVTFSVASATASTNSATVTLVGSVNFVNSIIGLTNLQIQVPAETRFLDVAIAPSLTGSVALDSFFNKQVLTLGLNPPTATVIGGVKAGANITIAPDGTISATGGGGGAFSSQVEWSTNSSSKNAYIDQSAGTINNQGIVIKLTASSGSGNLTNVTVILNGIALTNTYASTGTFPNYTITVPVGDITDVAAQTAASVSVACSGTYSGSNFNVANAGTLTNVQPIAFTTTLSGVYSPATLPFYTATSAINYNYTNSGAITAFNGVITPTGGTAQNATAASGTFASQPIAGASISGNATGTGQFGAGSSTVTLSGSIPAVSVYTPAFYVQTANSTPPTITTSSTQTAGAAQGSTVTYPTATVSTQYNWICTQRPLANIAVVTPFGNAPLVPDVTAPTQTISGQTFNVYGVTGLDTLNPVQLVIS